MPPKVGHGPGSGQACSPFPSGSRRTPQRARPVPNLRPAVRVSVVSAAQPDALRARAAALAPQAGQHVGKRRVTASLAQEPDGRRAAASTTAAQFEDAVRPVGEAMVRVEGRRVHGPAGWNFTPNGARTCGAAAATLELRTTAVTWGCPFVCGKRGYAARRKAVYTERQVTGSRNPD